MKGYEQLSPLDEAVAAHLLRASLPLHPPPCGAVLMSAPSLPRTRVKPPSSGSPQRLCWTQTPLISLLIVGKKEEAKSHRGRPLPEALISPVLCLMRPGPTVVAFRRAKTVIDGDTIEYSQFQKKESSFPLPNIVSVQRPLVSSLPSEHSIQPIVTRAPRPGSHPAECPKQIARGNQISLLQRRLHFAGSRLNAFAGTSSRPHAGALEDSRFSALISGRPLLLLAASQRSPAAIR
ncbi:hypothetical protein cypCar_00027466 [Cyprinus carpio]|nr:hypothetical protein cypCar_00027466 [Cyprinus carpio]